MPLIADAARQFNVPVVIAATADIAANNHNIRAQLDACPVLYLLNVEAESVPKIVEWVRASQAKHPQRRIIPLDARGVHAEFDKLNLLTHDDTVPKYWRANGPVNIKRLVQYTRVKYLGAQGTIEPAVLIPDFGFYDPDREDAFEDIASYKSFKTARGRWKQDAPVAALLIQQSFWITHDTKVVDAEVRALERNGVNAVVIFGDRQAMVEKLIRDTKPDAIIEDRHGAMWDNRKVLEDLDVPYLRPISMLGYTVDQWKKDPRGMSFRDVGLFMTVQESWGTLEPIVVGGLQADLSGYQLHEPIPDRVERFAERTASWLNLRRKPNSEKKIAIVYYNDGMGKDDLMRGSPTGAFLDAPESAVRFLPRMKQAGYKIDRLPANSAQLVEWMQRSGRNIGPWNQPALEDEVNTGEPALVSLAKYLHWFNEKLPAAKREEIIKKYGPAPGKMMVVERHGQKYIVIPQIKLGNVILAPQPLRGQTFDETLLHSRDIPPPHNYLAFYWWLQEEFHADAVVHWGTHGSLEMLPGKENGMAGDDWSDVMVGRMPIIDLWIMDNLAEAVLARRRTYAAIVDHMVPPTLPTAEVQQYRGIRDDLSKFNSLEPGLLKEQFRKKIQAGVAATEMPKLLGLKASLNDADLERVAQHIDVMLEERTTAGMHILGKAPTKDDELSYLVAILGHKFLEHIAEANHQPAPETPAQRNALQPKALELVRAALASVATGVSPVPGAQQPLTPDLEKDLDFARQMKAKLDGADSEITGLLRALEGHYIVPGPGPDPVRNPGSVPGGRMLYALNPEEIPTRAAWETGKQLIDEFLRQHHPHKVALDLNGMDTMRDFGVMESQVFYLMGVRPIWDRNNLAIDVEVIPQAELKRPRIDVFLAMGGQYKENFTTRVKLMDKAVRLVSALDEPDNYVRQGSHAAEQRLEARGMAADKARDLSMARIFGTKPGNVSGTNILFLVPRSGVWDRESEITDVYVDNMSYAYTGDLWGEKVDGLYQDAIQGTDSVLRVWASNMNSQLSNHHAYEYLGGLSMAIAQLTGKQPEAFIADVRNPDGARMRDFNEVLASNLESELLSKTWITKMQEHGYAGAAHAADLVKNTFGWSITRKDAITQGDWNNIYSVYVGDKYNVGMRAWMEKDNAFALQEIAATMLESSRKGYWKADSQSLQQVAKLYGELVVAHGVSGGIISGSNAALTQYVVSTLQAGNASTQALATKYEQVVHRAPAPAVVAAAAAGATGAASAGLTGGAPVATRTMQTITGQRMARVQTPTPPRQSTSRLLIGLTYLALLVLAALGFLTRRGELA